MLMYIKNLVMFFYILFIDLKKYIYINKKIAECHGMLEILCKFIVCLLTKFILVYFHSIQHLYIFKYIY
jgi:hypothetical protein